MIPTWAKPLTLFFIASVVFPGPSILSHILGLAAGYLMALGYLKYLIEPSSKVVLLIEGKIAFLINLIPDQLKYIKEVDAIEIRTNAVSVPTTSTELPLHELPAGQSSSNPITEIEK